jgi:quinol-cytochrome oxidoreductase complex cytochrome b subunit
MRLNNMLISLIRSHILFYPTPVSLNYFWGFGSLAGFFLVVQIFSGLFLAMHYCADTSLAFDSVQHIMRNVKGGWLVRYIHANGASMFLGLLYLHMARGIYYRSYTGDRAPVWYTGFIMFVLVMASAFIGYVLPWGQMSFWGATVITNLVSAIPIVGQDVAYWLWGGFAVGRATLVRFFALHFLLPFVVLGLTFLHLLLLHNAGSSNPLGDGGLNDYVPFYPYFILKDIVGLFIVLLFFVILIFFLPNLLSHPDNNIRANPLVTPAHIVPEWYFLPFYAILRAVPSKLGGVLAMGLSIIIVGLLPVIDYMFPAVWKPCTPGVRPWYRKMFWVWICTVILLGWLGAMPVEFPYDTLSRLACGVYFSFFFLPGITSLVEYLCLSDNGTKS